MSNITNKNLKRFIFGKIEKKITMILTLVLLVMFASCEKMENMNNINIKADILEDMDKNKIPRIVVDDIDDKDIKSTLLRIDSVNQVFGKDVEVSRDDFFNYRNEKICLIGDSIADCSKSSLLKYFSKISIDATPGREINTVVQIYKNAKAYEKLGDIVVVSLGTNAINGIPFELLEQVYNMLDGRPMIMFSVVMPYAGQERNRNRDIKKFIETHKNCYLADWNKVMKSKFEYFADDKIHPNGAGGEVYAQLLFKTIADICREKE